MGRPRTLLGTQAFTARIPTNLINALDEWAEEEGVSRNTLVSRELATAVSKRRKSE
jgi:predicted HicB family RNase H-like nuclease